METQYELIFDLIDEGGVHSFSTKEDVLAWIVKEEQYWKWLDLSRKGDSNIGDAWSTMLNGWQTIRKKIGEVNNIADLDQTILEQYSKRILIHSNTLFAKFIESIKIKDESIAAYCVCLRINIGFNFNGIIGNKDKSKKFLLALVEMSRFEKPFNNIEGFGSIYEELKQKYQTSIDNSEQQTRKGDRIISSWNEQLSALSAIKEEELNSLIDNAKERIEKTLTEGQKTLEDISNTYDQKLALQSSISYWREKEKHHRTASKKFSIFFPLVLFIFAFAIFFEIMGLFPENFSETPKTWEIGLVSITILVGIWISRILVRVLLSHIHLQRDSAERVTMIQTYLALLREGNGPKHDDRNLILQTLFRPSNSGIIKDDAMPTSFWEIITKSGK